MLNSGTCGSSDNGNNTCLVCSGDGCNAIDFPLANRLSCYSCLGDECFDSTNEAICPRMHPDERCATVFDISTGSNFLLKFERNKNLNITFCRCSD